MYYDDAPILYIVAPGGIRMVAFTPSIDDMGWMPLNAAFPLASTVFDLMNDAYYITLGGFCIYLNNWGYTHYLLQDLSASVYATMDTNFFNFVLLQPAQNGYL